MNRSCYCVWNLQSTEREPALAEMMSAAEHLGGHTREMLTRALEAREQAGATCIAPGIAMPHCRSILVDDFIIILGRSSGGVAWADDSVRLATLFISPVKPSGPQEHMDLIKHLVEHIRLHGPEKLTSAGSAAELAGLLGLELPEGGSDAPGS